MNKFQIFMLSGVLVYSIGVCGSETHMKWTEVGQKYIAFMRNAHSVRGDEYVQGNKQELMNAFLWNVRSFYGQDVAQYLSPSAVRAAGRDYLSQR